MNACSTVRMLGAPARARGRHNRGSGSSLAGVRMQQSVAEWEEAFHAERAEEHARQTRLRREAARRSRHRRARQSERHATLRFVGLVAAILATTVVVTVVMFETLAMLMG